MMFENQADGSVQEMLAMLEQHLPMLSDQDQAFVTGCRMTLEMGGTLTAQNQQEIRRIASTLAKAEHNTMEKPLSPKQMLQELGGVVHTLSQQEKMFLAPLAGKVKQGVSLSAEEVSQLIAIYTEKGF